MGTWKVWKEILRNVLRILFSLLMVICMFTDRVDLSSFAVLMLILMELEDLNKKVEDQ